MPTIDTYNQFSGIHWETGSVRNVLAHQGLTAPHTDEPFSEAMLLGLAGGITTMYFTFEYEGEDPHLFIGTRSTFDPLDTLSERAGLNAEFSETTSVNVARRTLVEALDEGQPSIVWADVQSLPYNGLEPRDYGYMQPVVVYGFEADDKIASVADRANGPLLVDADDLSEARSRQPSLKNRMATLNPDPDFGDFAASVEDGIRSTLGLYLGQSSKGAAGNFGLAALKKWAAMLVDTRTMKGWPNLFWPGAVLYRVLKTVFHQIEQNGTGGSASRPLYAEFLDEASLVLGNPDLRTAADLFRKAGVKWTALADSLLPDTVDVFAETRALMAHRCELFQTFGAASLDQRRAITARLKMLDAQIGADFPLDMADCHRLRENIREHVLSVHEVEREAVMALQSAVELREAKAA